MKIRWQYLLLIICLLPRENLGGDEASSTTKVDPISNSTTETPRGVESINTTSNPGQKENNDLDAISLKILRAEENGIGYSDMGSKENYLLRNITGMKAFSIDYHYKKQQIFYVAANRIWSDKVVRNFLFSGTPTPVVEVGVDGVVSLAVDWVHDTLYWLSIKHNQVESSNFDGTNGSLLVDNLQNTQFPNNIVIDPYEGLIFFTSNQTVYRATLNGKNLTVIHLEGMEGKPVKHVACDIQQKRLYITGQDKNLNNQPYLASCDYQGQNVKNIPLRRNVWNDIFSLSVFRDTLYFAHYPKFGGDSLWSLELSDSFPKPEICYAKGVAADGINAIKVYHPDVQEKPTQG